MHPQHYLYATQHKTTKNFMNHTFHLTRRSFIAAASSSIALASLGLSPLALAQIGLKLGEARAFSFTGLIKEAMSMAQSPYQTPPQLPSDVLHRIDYDAHGKIIFNPDNALFKDGPGQYPITFFHMGRYFQTPVHMHVLQEGLSPDTQTAQEILYDPGYFDMPADSPAHELPPGIGFAGFRLQESRLGDQQKLNWHNNDWAAFLGASYFRAIGALYQYGISARGVAIDVTLASVTEEFPAFTHFYFAPQHEDSNQVTVYALLDGPSITGAYQFILERNQAVLIDVEAHLFLRRDIERLGLAPLTSMYWFSETNKIAGVNEWRPEVHDSDGLSLWNSSGEHIWRPLNTPQQSTVSTFSDQNPRGFGLMQRDRNFDHYLDGVAYERRPSLWVEPLEDWGNGAVQLVEIPTYDEVHDNIVAFWVPQNPAKAGDQYTLRYRLHWSDREPFPSPLAQCVATRMGMGGQPGAQYRPVQQRKFVVEFLGGPLVGLPYGEKPEAILWSSRGQFKDVFTEPVPDGINGHWRAQFDFIDDDNSQEAVEMRLFLRYQDNTLSETWLYQYHPDNMEKS